MESLHFDVGYKEYAINDDENSIIRINTKDYGTVARIKKMDRDARALMTEYNKIIKDQGDERIIDTVNELDDKIRSIINETFQSDVCTAAFGGVNCISISGSQPIFMNFLDALVPKILEDIKAEQVKAEKRIKSYAAKAKDFK